MSRRHPLRLLLAAAAVTLVACGSPNKVLTHKPAVKTPIHQCTPANTALQCNLPPPPKNLTPPAPGVSVTARGVDFACGGSSVSSMRANGWSFGASYLSYDFSKNWSRSQASSYANAGIARVFVWETSATRALSGCEGGASDARAANSQGAAFGARVIYFAVDFEAQGWQVAPYFRCAGQVIGTSRLGAYGGYSTINGLFNSHLIRYGWQTYAWSGGRWDGRAQLQQWYNGNAYDYDRAVVKDYGQTPFSQPKPRQKPAPSKRAKEAELRGIKANILVLHNLEAKRHCRTVHGRKAYGACKVWGPEGRHEHKRASKVEAEIRHLR